jgi:hypothetical protein
MAIMTGFGSEAAQLQQKQSTASPANMRNAVALYARYVYLTSSVQMHAMPLLVVTAVSGMGQLFRRSEKQSLQFGPADTQ